MTKSTTVSRNYQDDAHKTLAVVIPTKGSPRFLDAVLKHYASFSATNFFDLHICDSSSDDGILKVVNKYSDILTINYHRLPTNIGFDEQTYEAIKIPQTKYVFLCGHGAVLPQDKLCRLLHVISTTNYDVLVTVGGWCDVSAHAIDACDKLELFKHWYAAMTMYGGTVLSRTLIDRFERQTVKKYWGTFFAYTCSIFEYLSGPVYIFADTMITITEEKMRSGSFWTKSRIVEMWSTNYGKSIDLLPSLFNPAKRDAMKLHAKNILSSKSLMYYRTTGNYDLKIFRQNKQFLPLTAGCGHLRLLFIALVPRVFFMAAYFLKHRKKPWKKKTNG